MNKHATRKSDPPDVRFGSKADIGSPAIDVRFDSVPSEGLWGATNGKGNRSNHGVPLVVMFAEAGRAADLSGSYTFKQSDGSEYTTTFVIKEKGSGLGSTVTGSVNWGHKKNNQDSPDGKLENADWVVKKAERKDLGESQPATKSFGQLPARGRATLKPREQSSSAVPQSLARKNI
jgi:hypothetical protein